MSDAKKLDPEAKDLFGYPPKRKKQCPGCGIRAEPYADLFCWLCTASGQRDFVLSSSDRNHLRACGVTPPPRTGATV